MNLLDALMKSPGFVYQIGTKYYFLGKYICRPCDSLEITDTLAMYDLCSSEEEEANTAYYFQKLRAYSDFALEAPFHAAKHEQELAALLESLPDSQRKSLETQYLRFAKHCGMI